jgi:hypothetical protein
MAATKEMQKTLIGGSAGKFLKPSDITEPIPVNFRTYSMTLAKSGERFDFELKDTSGKSYVLSSWSIVTQRKRPVEDFTGELVIKPSVDGKKIYVQFPDDVPE